MPKLLLFFIALVLVFSLAFTKLTNAAKPNPSPKPNPVTITENWISRDDVATKWDVVTQDCYSVPTPGILEMFCQSGGLKSKQFWNKSYDITVSGTVSAENSQPSTTTPSPGAKTYWGGLTIFDQEFSGRYEDSRYGEIAAQPYVHPFPYTPDSIISLTDDSRRNNTKVFGPYVPGSTHLFQIKYVASQNKYYYYVDDLNTPLQNIQAKMLKNPDIFVLCVAVSPGQSDSTAQSHCKFGPITVTGVPQ